jgi:ribosomal protein S6--L-glutamate ligase/tetrahydromethanopterin:alpha-L-glutamate ligase
MRIGILTRNENSWCSAQLKEAVAKHNFHPVCFSFPNLVAKVGLKPRFSLDEIDLLRDIKAIIVRPIGRGSLEEVIFRMDMLHRLKRLGLYILNPPLAIERSVDKYHALSLLEEAGLPVPRTVVTEKANNAKRAFHELGGDVVIKPIFGSRGIGSTRISDPDVAERIFRALEFQHQVIYLQEYVPHGNYDLRVFVLGGRVIASMKRISNLWKTNVSLGAKPAPCQLTGEIENLAIKAAEVVGCDMAGVDILESDRGPLIVELNSQPGWRGLQTVTSVNIAEEIICYVLNKVKECEKFDG